MKKLSSIWYSVIGSVMVLAPSAALAQGPFEKALDLADQTGKKAGITTEQNLPTIIGGIINALLGFLGIVFLVLLIYAGFLWMTAQGEDAKVKKARDMISQAVIGLVIVVAAFAISNFVLGSLINVTKAN